MIHIVTNANRLLYEAHLREMHRMRWNYYIEHRKWRALREMQHEEGYERDEYDDRRAMYLLALSPEGHIQGSMRLRPTDDKSLLTDHFSYLIEPEANFRTGPDVWEITRVMRAPEVRGSDGALRLQMNCAAVEFALSRGVTKFITAADSFLLPATRALNRHKHQVLGLPHPYEEGEVVGIQYDIDTEGLEMTRHYGGWRHPMMLELPIPCRDQAMSVEHAELITRGVRSLPRERVEALIAWLHEEGRVAQPIAA
jgi:acyl-homoserine lactone synthase